MVGAGVVVVVVMLFFNRLSLFLSSINAMVQLGAAVVVDAVAVATAVVLLERLVALILRGDIWSSESNHNLGLLLVVCGEVGWQLWWPGLRSE